MSMQVKLLRLIETGTFHAVGRPEVKRSDFRLIYATHKDLTDLVARGVFRYDLYYQINIFTIHLPSVAVRQSGLPFLAKTLLTRLGQSGTEYHITGSAMKIPAKYQYKGDIRELNTYCTEP